MDRMLRLFNCTTEVRIYDLPNHGVWARVTVPDKHVREKCGGGGLEMRSSAQDHHCKGHQVTGSLGHDKTGISNDHHNGERPHGALCLTEEFFKTVGFWARDSHLQLCSKLSGHQASIDISIHTDTQMILVKISAP